MSDKTTEIALGLWGNQPGNILNYIIESAVEHRITPDKCDRCNKRFRIWRKRYLIMGVRRLTFICLECVKNGEVKRLHRI